MEPSTLLRCPRMEECPSLETKLVQDTELDIVTLNVLMILNGFKEKLTFLIGNQVLVILTLGMEDMDLAVKKWISGKLTLKPKLTLLILVPSMVHSDAMELNVEMVPTDTTVFATKMDAIPIHIDWEFITSLERT
jgi:hypothetical protein